MRTLKLMADYGCYPLWEILPDGVRNINPKELSISPKLMTRLNEWADKYDQTLNWEEPTKSGFAPPNAEKNFRDEGMSILEELKAELNSLFEITYYIPEGDRP